MSYNGYTNYETWCVNLWIDNQSAQQSWWWAAEARRCYSKAKGNSNFSKLEVAVSMLADRLKDDHEDGASEAIDSMSCGNGVFGDLLRAALSEVDWHEIATNLLEGVEDAED